MSDKNFPYNPSLAASVIFSLLFGFSALFHSFQGCASRTRYMIKIVVATNMQLVGYACRSIVIQNPDRFTFFRVSQALLVVAPTVLATQVYMVVGRMMSYVGPESTFISHTVITKVFVVVHWICFLTQTLGSALFFQEDPLAHLSQLKIARTVLFAGFVFQIGALCLFTLVTILFHRKSIQLKGDKLRPLRPFFWSFYIIAALIMIRSIYRTIEFDFIKGAGYLYDHEWPLYVLDAALILSATVIFNICHPSRYLPRKKGERMDGTIEAPRKHWWSQAPPSAAAQSVVMGQRPSSVV